LNVSGKRLKNNRSSEGLNKKRQSSDSANMGDEMDEVILKTLFHHD
jgi:hypothetical protein